MPDDADPDAPDRPPPRYNEIYEQLVRDEGDLVGMVAYALYKQSKRAWIVRFEKDEGHRPTSDETFRSYVKAQGPHELERLRNQADALFSEYSGIVLQRERPIIEAGALKAAAIEDAKKLHKQIAQNTRWYKGVWTSMLGALLYSLLLIIVALILSWVGVDVLGVLEKARPPHSP